MFRKLLQFFGLLPTLKRTSPSWVSVDMYDALSEIVDCKISIISQRHRDAVNTIRDHAQSLEARIVHTETVERLLNNERKRNAEGRVPQPVEHRHLEEVPRGILLEVSCRCAGTPDAANATNEYWVFF